MEQDLGIAQDDTPDTCTLSELLETFEMWESFVRQAPFKTKQLFTMFETSDVHPDVLHAMKLFDRVIVPFEYLKNILLGHGVNATALGYYTSPLIRSSPVRIPKLRNRLVFLYIGTNDIRKNLVSLTRVFAKAAAGRSARLIVKTNRTTDLVESENIKYITERISPEKLACLYNICDYVISFTPGEGVGLPMIEASYFGKPVIAHDQGVFQDVKKCVKTPWHVLPAKEVEIPLSDVPPFLQKVFHGTWWEVDEDAALDVIKNLMDE